jgi:hypothetical protein
MIACFRGKQRRVPTKLMRCAFLLAFFSPVAVAEEPAPPFNALRPKGKGPEEIVLTRRVEQTPLDVNRRSPGRYPWLASDYEIVLPAQATTQEQKAAYELEHWLEEFTGVVFPVVSDAAASQRKAIHIGPTRGFLQSGLPDPREGLKDEGYSIQVKEGNLYLHGGRRRGPINAVLALLEEDLDCRWYSDDVNIIPRKAELSFRPVPRSFVPKLECREPFYWESLTPLWSLRNRTNSTHVPIPEAWGGHTFWALRTHSHTLLVPPTKYLGDHPEYYGLKNRSSEREPRLLCLTNPDLVPIVAEAVRDILRQHPTAKAIMIAKEDGFRHGCFCPRCTALSETEGSLQAAELLLVNAVAEKLEHEFPHVLFCGYAYTYTLKAPKTICPRKNVGIRFCNNDTHDEPFTCVADHAGFQENFRGWKAICNNIFIYDYWQNPSHPLAPLPNMEMIARNIRWFAEQGVREVSGLGTATWYPSGDRTEMRAWVLAKLLWDPQWDVHELMRDFALHYYGNVGPVMLEYDELLQLSLQQHAEAMRCPEGGRRFAMTAPIYSREFLERATAILGKAEREADSESVRERVRRVARTIQYVRQAQTQKGS